jgi:glycine dehydrogenase subunit 1
MDFISNKEPQNREMRRALGIQNVEELFCAIPDHLRIPPPFKDDGLSEYEGLQWMEALAEKNHFSQYESYLGAGAYQHHVPALVETLCSKSEFLTSYTPYQAEASQGMLQAIFEFQTALCGLTGLDVANASLYDGASACAEALLMAIRATQRSKVVVAQQLHPHYRGVIEQYLRGIEGVSITWAPYLSNGCIDKKALKTLCDQDTAALLLQYPNFFGIVEDIKGCQEIAKATGALTVICANPLVYALYASAAELQADIAVGDCQPFGISLQYGGPYVGYMACRQELLRQLPGRIVGETVDAQGKRGFVLTLQTREQHIRREKATSNICTNQALAALASLVHMLWYGKGLHALALTNYQRAAYLRSQLQPYTLPTPLSDSLILNEFVIRLPTPLSDAVKQFRAQGIEPGVDLGTYYPELQEHLLVAVTEIKSKQQLDRYVAVCREIVQRS